MSPDDPKLDSAPQGDAAAVAEPALQVKKPQLYKVLLHNDDYTTMEFVVMILMTVFHHDEPSSVSVMLQVHQKGVGVAGVYSGWPKKTSFRCAAAWSLIDDNARAGKHVQHGGARG
jgi:ATP-dependent Clp protease adaptor protein ClpS